MKFGSSHQQHLLYLGTFYSHFKTQLGHHHLQEAILDFSCQPILIAVFPFYIPSLYSPTSILTPGNSGICWFISCRTEILSEPSLDSQD